MPTPNTIVLNTATGAVSEYADFTFTAILPGYAGSPLGFYALDGDLDVTAPIVAILRTGRPMWNDGQKMFPDLAWAGVVATPGVEFQLSVIDGAGTRYDYPMVARAEPQSRAKLGRGIKSAYLQYEFSNPNGEDFRLGRIDVLNLASSRRV